MQEVDLLFVEVGPLQVQADVADEDDAALLLRAAIASRMTSSLGSRR